MEPPSADAASRGICSEDTIIDTLSRSAPVRRALRVGNGDDAVVFPDGTAVTVDVLCEGVHFDDRLSAADVGFKAVAVSVSDLAAMGAEPERFVLAVCHPGPSHEWTQSFAEGVGEACRTFGIDLVGGDTTRASSISVGVTAFGQVVAEPLVRSGAMPGDVLYVVGWLGLAGAGYRLAEPSVAALDALRRPRPPVSFALDLARRGWASAAMDASDGPARDLPRLARASGVRVVLDPGAIPVHADLLDHAERRDLMLGAGDDYALLFTSSAPLADLDALATEHGVAVAAIGHLEAGEGAVCTDGAWPSGAWSHFGERS
ncbi:MAG: thiamine-phosphate kinase [Proteobacteria bacterium]|nr:thiamine-phosphate kinase [Pseudomonadota bacterium]